MIKAAVVVVTPVFLQVLVLWKRLDCFLFTCPGLQSSQEQPEETAEQQKY